MILQDRRYILFLSIIIVGLIFLIFNFAAISRNEKNDIQLKYSYKFDGNLDNLNRSLLYWKDRSSLDYDYWPRGDDNKYLVWYSWNGGFNNKRMSLELAYSFAFLLNRTLVLPPRAKHYNLETFTYEDFFDIEDMNKSINIITYDEFKSKYSYVGNNYEGVESYATPLNWKEIHVAEGIFVFPTQPHKVKEKKEYEDMLLFASQKKKIIRDVNDFNLDNPIVYFPKSVLFGHFYTYFYLRDRNLDLYLKKMIREHVHYKEEIYLVADNIMNQMFKEYNTREYYSIHLRRGDFFRQYKSQMISGERLYNNIYNLIPEGSLIYISTDESNNDEFKKNYLSILEKRYKVSYFRKYKVDFNYPDNWDGPIEQIICSRAIKFVGTKLSTFSGYIVRLRGYMDDIQDKNTYFTDTHYPDGYNDTEMFKTTYPSWSYWTYYAHWGREFKESWEIYSNDNKNEY